MEDMDIMAKQVIDPKCEKSVPRFHLRAIQDEEASKKAGHPIFKDVEYVEVHHPGQRNTVPCLRVKEHHIEAWPRHYDAFKRGEDAPIEGYRIEEWPPVTAAMAETLKAMQIPTVESLAAIPESALGGLGTAYQSLRLKAQVFLEEHGSEKARIEKLEKENNSLLERLEKLEAASSSKEDTPEKAETKEPDESLATTKAKAKGK